MTNFGENKDPSPLLLDFAANNDVEGFKRSVCDESQVKAVGLWYSRDPVSKKMVVEQRTPLMVAAKYGSLEIVQLILSLPGVDVNFSCGLDNTTALHCAASSGSVRAVDVVKWLLLAGADTNVTDANGFRPYDVLVAPPNSPFLKIFLVELLKNNDDSSSVGGTGGCLRSISPPLSSSSSSSTNEGSLSPVSCKPNNNNVPVSSAKKEYPPDPTLPDVKSSLYASDEFRMYMFKIRPCSRTYTHDWTECPFVHPGENARRRDPRKFHYSCMPCPDHRKGLCKRGDLCEYSHGIFECWLHPSQYRTRVCNDGTGCRRRVCFFAHTKEELRTPSGSNATPLLSSSQPAPLDFAAALNQLPPPTSITPPCNDSNLSMAWPHQQNITNWHIPAANENQAGHLTTSFPASDLHPLEFSRRLLNELSVLPQQQADLLLYKLIVLHQLQQQRSMLSQANTAVPSATYANHHLLQFWLGSSPLGRMPTRVYEPASAPTSYLPPLSHHEEMQQKLSSLSLQGRGSNLSNHLAYSRSNSWPANVGAPANENGDWSLQNDELSGQLTEDYGEEPDLSWIQSMLKDPSDTNDRTAA
ncbi:hypothetical protein Tsubulata_012540 [Turnera subulata]|uniref:C3H1-type domain-containing protein n=1 Tax=Turnera subulata TaxID=218843 RepID=A0A9Q0F5N0_9ROSI|nr:hypothetical protein Tsubulata_012540 [Turnera subulata]